MFSFFPDQLLGNDSKQNFEDLKVNLSDVEVLSSETRRSLSNLSDSGVDDIDFDAFLNEVMLSSSSREYYFLCPFLNQILLLSLLFYPYFFQTYLINPLFIGNGNKSDPNQHVSFWSWFWLMSLHLSGSVLADALVTS